MLEQLRIENFKRHTRLDLMFTPGLNLVTGTNYSGKSTILHAILFAFFGVSAVPGGSKIVPKRGEKPARTRVVAQFYHNGKTYRIDRKISSARLYCGEELIASSLSGVSKHLEEIFNIPQKFFMRLKYAQQGETQALLTLGVGELHNIIEHVSGASLVNRIIDRAAKLATAAKNKIDAVGPSPDLVSLEQHYLGLRDDLNLRYMLLEDVNKQLAEVKQNHAGQTEEYNKGVVWNNQQNLLKTALATHNSQIQQATAYRDSAHGDVTKHAVLAKQAGELDTQAREERKLLSRHKELNTQLKKYRDRTSKVEDYLTNYKGKLADLRGSIAGIGTIYEPRAYQEKSDAQAAIAIITSEEIKLRKLITDSVCPTCGREFEGADTEMAEDDLGSLRVDADEARKRLQAAEEVVRAVSAKKDKLSDLESREQLVSHEMERAVKESAESEENVRATSERIASLRVPADPAAVNQMEEGAREAYAANGAYQEASKVYDEQESLVKKLKSEKIQQPGELVNVSALEQQVSTLADMERQLSTDVTAKTSEYTSRHGEWRALSERLTAAREHVKKTKKFHVEQEAATALAKYLRSNRDRFMQEMWEQVTGFASNFAEICTSGVIEKVERTSDGAFEFTEEGQAMQMAGASGAQKSIMSVGVQLALDTLLPDTFSALLLDEPTSDMDTDRALALTQALSQSGRQIIMVSHREMDSSLAQSHIHLGK